MRPAKQTVADAERIEDGPAAGPDVDEHPSHVLERSYGSAQARPPARVLRFFKAYWVTFVVICSYLSLRFQARFRSEQAIARVQRRKNLKNARRIEGTIVQLQGLFIKVGQLISIMTNFLPEEFRRELEGLQDMVPPRPYRDIEKRLREEFDGKGPGDLFQSFDERPIASASIGQVHLARMHDGTRVAVKVQYPGIEEIVRSDLKTLRRIFRIIAWFVSYDGLEDVYREVELMIMEELDFRREAANAQQIQQNFEGRHNLRCPTVVPALSTARILTTHFERGIKIGDVSRLDRDGFDRSELARLVVEAYCKQIFTDGFYHADPHPGNLLVRRDDKGEVCIVFLDFGAVAEISPEMRHGMIELLQGALSNDSDRIVRALKQMGFVSRGADEQVFDRVVEYFHDYFQEQISLDSLNLKDIKFDPQKGLERLADLRRMDISLRELTQNFYVPKEWILLERTLLLLMGLCTALDPTMNPVSVVRPYLERFVLGPEGDWSSLLVETTKDLAKSVTSLPGDMRKFMKAARGGDLSFRFKNLDRASRVMYRLGHQAIAASIGIAGAAIAVVFEGRGQYDRAEIAWYVAVGAGVYIVWSWWSTRGIMRRRR